MQAATLTREEFVDPVGGMTVDPARAAGASEGGGVLVVRVPFVSRPRLRPS